jgi:hypothetical protein
MKADIVMLKCKPFFAFFSFYLPESRIAHACPTWGAFLNEFALGAHIRIVNKI